MSVPPVVDPRWVELFIARAADLSGFRPEAVPRASVERALQREAERAALGDLASEAGLQRLLRHTVVGETFFFRQPEHFGVLTDVSRRRQRGQPLRAWSAGCATGEEAYSLSAYLQAELPGEPGAIDVVGSDLVEEHLEVAAQGCYGRWSVRPNSPLTAGLFDDVPGPPYRVRDTIRAATRFVRHNLLDPAPGGPFDVIFCRNVLVYFTADSAARAIGNLVHALAPGGVLCFGPMDLSLARPALPAVGGAELCSFQRPRGAVPVVAAVALPARAPVAAPDPVALHLEALTLLEHGALEQAGAVLTRLADMTPEYLPGAAELALLCERRGEHHRAVALMQGLLARIGGLSPEHQLPGPEPLTVAYYRLSAEAFLARAGGGS